MVEYHVGGLRDLLHVPLRNRHQVRVEFPADTQGLEPTAERPEERPEGAHHLWVLEPLSRDVVPLGPQADLSGRDGGDSRNRNQGRRLVGPDSENEFRRGHPPQVPPDALQDRCAGDFALLRRSLAHLYVERLRPGDCYGTRVPAPREFDGL